MNSRQRVLRTFHFQSTDRPPCDLMEGILWQELKDYFYNAYNYTTPEQIIEHFDPDFRWVVMNQGWDRTIKIGDVSYKPTWGAAIGPLADISYNDILKLKILDIEKFVSSNFQELRIKHPDKALVFCPGWIPLFWSACDAFGSEEALIKMINEPKIFNAFLNILHEESMEVIKNGIEHAKGTLDILCLGDDFASQQSMIISPESWRKFIKPLLAKQVRLARESGLLVMYHSCGAVRPILNDLIEIGINALSVFQTNANGMDAESISGEFGGELAFYGGIDVQHLLCYGTVEEIQNSVTHNIKAFEKCGGYIVANAHCGIPEIKGENLEIMFDSAKNHFY